MISSYISVVSYGSAIVFIFVARKSVLETLPVYRMRSSIMERLFNIKIG